MSVRQHRRFAGVRWTASIIFVISESSARHSEHLHLSVVSEYGKLVSAFWPNERNGLATQQGKSGERADTAFTDRANAAVMASKQHQGAVGGKGRQWVGDIVAKRFGRFPGRVGPME